MAEPTNESDSMSNGPQLSESQRVFLFMAGFEVGLGVLAVLMGWLTGIDPRAHMPKLHQAGVLARDFGIGVLATIPMVIAMVGIELLPLPGLKTLVDVTKQLVIPMMRKLSLSQIVVVAFSAGVGEELLFRGWLQTSLAGPPSASSLTSITTLGAILVGAIAFGLAHYISPAYFFFATLFGVYLGVLYCWSESLWVPIVAHGLYDLVAILWLLHEDRSQER